MAGTEPPEDPAARGRDFDARGVIGFGFWLVVACVAIALAMWGLFRLYKGEARAAQRPLSPVVAANLRRTPPEPRLESNPLAPRLRIRAEEDAILSTYAWIDKKKGVVRLPIDRAMELLIARGLPPSVPMPAASAGSASSAAAPPNPAPAQPPPNPAPGASP